jgi:endoglycosylceramidase
LLCACADDGYDLKEAKRCEIDAVEAGALSTQGTDIVDSQGRIVSLRGINTGGRSKYPPYSAFDYDEGGYDAALSAYLDRAQGWGFSVLRVPFSWNAAEPSPGTWDETYLDRYAALLDGAWERGLWTIVDFHQDVYAERYCGDGFPEWTLEGEGEPSHDCPDWFIQYAFDDEVRGAFDDFWANERGTMDAFEAMWTEMATRHADRPGVIGFEIINEPHGGTASPAEWAADVLGPFYTHMAELVWDIAPDALVFFDTTGMDSTLTTTSLSRPEGANLVFAPHYYDPGALFDFSLSMDVPASLQNWADLGVQWDLPVLLGEFGIDGTHRDRVNYLSEHYESFDALGMHATLWEYSDSTELWNGEDLSMVDTEGQERTDVLEVVVRPVLRALAGREAQLTWNENHGSLRLDFEADVGGVTELVLPTWVYGDDLEALRIGAEEACVAVEGRILRIEAEGDEVAISVDPL